MILRDFNEKKNKINVRVSLFLIFKQIIFNDWPVKKKLLISIKQKKIFKKITFFLFKNFILLLMSSFSFF